MYSTQLLKTLSVSEPEQLVELGCVNTNEPDKLGCNTSYPGFRMLRDENEVLSGLFAFAPAGELNAIYNGEAELATGLLATGDMHKVLGVSPALGRLLNPSDDAASAPPVAVLSHSYWQRRFGGDARVIGQILRLNTSAVTIVGVTAAAFRGITLGASPDITLAMGSSAELFRGKGILENGGNWWLRIIGRRKDGISIQQVQASLEPIFQRTIEHSMSSLPAEFASRIRGYVSGIRFRVQPAAAGGASEFRRDLDRPLRILMAVVSFILLIACADLASLLLSRTAARRCEFGVRLAIGAGRSRLARQLLTESLLLSAMGGALGLMMAQWSGSVFLKMASGEIGLRAVELKPDVPVFLFTATVALLSGILLGLGPILHLTKADPQAALRDMVRAAAEVQKRPQDRPFGSTTSRSRWPGSASGVLRRQPRRRVPDLYLPMQASLLLVANPTISPAGKFLERNYYWLEIMARLRPGVTLAQAQATLALPFHQWLEGTASNDEERANLPELLLREGAGGLDALRRHFSKPLYVLMLLVGLILAIACANIANLLLARAAVRAALGAGRGRLAAQFLTESLVLAGLGFIA